MRRVVWAETAHRDLLAIYEFYEAIDPAIAERISTRITKAAESLTIVPTTRRSRVSGVLERTVPDTHYVLAFTRTLYVDGRELYEIVRIIHTSRDWQPGKPPPK